MENELKLRKLVLECLIEAMRIKSPEINEIAVHDETIVDDIVKL